MNRTHKIKLCIIALLLLTTTLTITLSMNKAKAHLVNLGYKETDASKKVTISNMYNVVDDEKENLTKAIENKKVESKQLGITTKEIKSLKLSNEKLYTNYNKLNTLCDKQKEDLQEDIASYEKLADSYKLKYKYKSTNLYDKYKYIKSVVSKNETALLASYKKSLTKLGFSDSSVEKLVTKKTNSQAIKVLKTTIAKEKARIKKLDGFQTSELKQQAMRMFKLTNEYRKSKGLKPYTYNYDQQACVFKEAKAYAENKNPHNWLCAAAANENAGLSSVNSDYVKVAMDFFISDPPHEAVLSGNYSSVAIAIVTKDNMNYMIMDVFN